ncbi:MAG: hypothetical protein V1806_17760 [Pseudomonadota bacterium]
MNIRKFLESWNGILLILFLGIYLMLPALKAAWLTEGVGLAGPAAQVQLLVGGLAVIWALWAMWGKLGRNKDE